MLGAAGVSWLRVWVTGGLQLLPETLGPLGHYGLFLLLGAFLAGAVWVQLQALRAPPPSPVRAAVLIQLAAAVAVPFTSTDLYSNLAYGWLERAGLDPYRVGPRVLGERAALAGTRWLDAPSVYGPLVQAVDWLAAAAHGVPGAMALYKAQMLLASLVLVALAWAYCRRLPEPERSRSFVLVGWSPLLAWEISAQGHNDGLLLVCVAGFVLAATAGRTVPAAICVALMLGTKPAGLPLAGLWLWMLLRRSPWRALKTGALVAGVLVLLYLPIWSGPATLRGQLGVLLGDPTNTSRSFIELARWLAAPLGVLVQARVVQVGTMIGRLLLLATAALALWRVRSLEDVLRWTCIFILVNGLLAAAAFQPWYVTWLLPLAMAERDARWQRLYGIYAALTVLQYGLDLDPPTYLLVNGIPLALFWPLLREELHRPLQARPAAA